jgi:hypothetical protein
MAELTIAGAGVTEGAGAELGYADASLPARPTAGATMLAVGLEITTASVTGDQGLFASRALAAPAATGATLASTIARLAGTPTGGRPLPRNESERDGERASAQGTQCGTTRHQGYQDRVIASMRRRFILIHSKTGAAIGLGRY